jgi:hypothetical protein
MRGQRGVRGGRLYSDPHRIGGRDGDYHGESPSENRLLSDHLPAHIPVVLNAKFGAASGAAAVKAGEKIGMLRETPISHRMHPSQSGWTSLLPGVQRPGVEAGGTSWAKRNWLGV